MEASAGSEAGRVRLIGLGNELLADDAFGILVAREAARRFPGLEVVETSESGLALLDYLSGVSCLLIVDTIQTGKAEPGTLYSFDAADLRAAPAGALHGAGLREVLDVADALGIGRPDLIRILAVEAADCATLGGPMHPAVESAVAAALDWIGAQVATLTRPGCGRRARSLR
ncbi:MAG: hydrogenase maturation protease [Bryobacterales bacterium]|nr:hydrogenase maturation protease [Bryobacteraceae bacterium]MDW8131835.1 hydrogenase maturation protease [Bryobacterales bacterium]